MASLTPLSMSQSKDDLLKHMNLEADIYSMMAKETDKVYRWLTSNKSNLKKNCKKKPPYDWSDILEKSKDEAMIRIANSSNEYTRYYWDLGAGSSSDECPNWVARWFLYHKFRYRDGRNRNPAKDEAKHHQSQKPHHQKQHAAPSQERDDSYQEYEPTLMTSGNAVPYQYAQSATNAVPQYSYEPSTYTPNSASQYYDQSSSKYRYDPVRDATNGGTM